jgi:hypothetical protein
VQKKRASSRRPSSLPLIANRLGADIAGTILPLGTLSLFAVIWKGCERSIEESVSLDSSFGAKPVKEGLKRLIATTGADEAIVVTDTWDHSARLESYRRVAAIAGSIEMKSTEKTAESAIGAQATGRFLESASK